MSGLLPLAEALERVLSGATPTAEVETRRLIDARGCVLAADMASTVDVPPADNSAMDGYALSAADATGPLNVSQRIPAGSVPDALQPGTAARIFTGATVPPGADVVVMQENCSEVDGTVTVSGAVTVGDNIRRQGQDIASGDTALRKGRRLRPQDMGLLASLGLAEVPVYRPLRVAVLSTGDELVEPGAPLADESQIYNSNRYTLAGLISALGFEFVDGGIVPDDPDATADALSNAAANADCVITSGGVSVGEEDHVKAQVERLGRLDLWKLAIKPGKPLAFGRVGQTPFIGLPGNPSSVFVTFCLVARPFLMRLQGMEDIEAPRLTATAGFEVKRAGSRQDYLRVSVRPGPGGLVAERFPNQSSGVLSSVSHSNALAVIPVGTTVAKGDRVDVLLLDLLTA